MITPEAIKKYFWALPINETLEALETASSGLTELEVKRRRELFGPNAIAQKKRAGKIILFLNQLKSPLIFLLYACVSIS